MHVHQKSILLFCELILQKFAKLLVHNITSYCYFFFLYLLTLCINFGYFHIAAKRINLMTVKSRVIKSTVGNDSMDLS